MTQEIIEFQQVTKVYRQKDAEVVALRDVSLTVARGEIFGIIGLSGAGKSTLLRSINRLEVPQSGRVLVDGSDITGLSGPALRQARRKIGMIFQHFNLLASRTVRGNIAFPLEIAKVAPAAIEQRVRELAQLVGLADKLDAYPAQLSGGQKQRVGIARALANQPEILLCDEATSALDPQTTQSILELLRDVNRRFGLTIVLITHQIEVIKAICDSVAMMEDGRVVEHGPVVEVFAQPRTATAHRFIESALHGEVPAGLRLAEPGRAAAGTGGRRVRISFLGEVARQPIIAALIRRFDLNVNILYANLDFIKDTPFGSLIVELTGAEDSIEKSLQYLADQGLRIEVIADVEPAALEPAR
jgi:D-methionine transport system ATP-binding protein